jgi:hypothetical protein
MIECSCDFDSDSEGAFDRGYESVREYRTCGECGSVIWPWETHVVGLWWDCEDCPESCEDPGGSECDDEREPDAIAYMCATCDRVVEQLMCGTWWIGCLWEQVAEENEMDVQECIEGER